MFGDKSHYKVFGITNIKNEPLVVFEFWISCIVFNSDSLCKHLHLLFVFFLLILFQFLLFLFLFRVHQSVRIAIPKLGLSSALLLIYYYFFVEIFIVKKWFILFLFLDNLFVFTIGWLNWSFRCRGSERLLTHYWLF